MKELRDRFIQGKSALVLSKVQDIHVVCGLLKDFLRKLKEPLITFRLHKAFMEVSGWKNDPNRFTRAGQPWSSEPQPCGGLLLIS